MFEFDSDRKRMSVIVRDPRDKKVKMFTKGADSVIKSRLCTEVDQPNLRTTEFYVDDFSKLGLRTLMIAMKVINEDEWVKIEELIKQCSCNPVRDDVLSKNF